MPFFGIYFYFVEATEFAIFQVPVFQRVFVQILREFHIFETIFAYFFHFAVTPPYERLSAMTAPMVLDVPRRTVDMRLPELCVGVRGLRLRFHVTCH